MNRFDRVGYVVACLYLLLALAVWPAARVMGEVGASAGPMSRFAEGLVAFWDFRELKPPFLAQDGIEKGRAALVPGNGHDVPVLTEGYEAGPLGRAIALDGKRFLRIPPEEIRRLNIGKYGREYSIVAWVRRSGFVTETAFVAGQWWEGDDQDVGQRAYGMFAGLGMSPRTVVGHHSWTGGATPPNKWCTDYSRGMREIDAVNRWRFMAVTYDGAEGRAYIDGCFEPHAGRNPFPFPAGINPNSTADFRIGATKHITDTNWFIGAIAGVAVFNVALTAQQIMDIHVAHANETVPLFECDFFRFNHARDSQPLSTQSWRALSVQGVKEDDQIAAVHIRAVDASDELHRFMRLPRGTDPVFVSYDHFVGAPADAIGSINFRLNNNSPDDRLQVCVRIGSQWYVSEQVFGMRGSADNDRDWSTAELRSLRFTRNAYTWRPLTAQEGAPLTVGEPIGTVLEPGVVTGVGFLVGPRSGIVRIDDVIITKASAAPQP